nr:hypothetical protein [Tanacetum cinerariifolium]
LLQNHHKSFLLKDALIETTASIEPGIKFNSDDDDPLYTLQSTLLFEDTMRCEYGLVTRVMYLEGETQLCKTQVGSSLS